MEEKKTKRKTTPLEIKKLTRRTQDTHKLIQVTRDRAKCQKPSHGGQCLDPV
jgi:hypothetical protein